jgi:hypothetical protein
MIDDRAESQSRIERASCVTDKIANSAHLSVGSFDGKTVDIKPVEKRAVRENL